MPHGEALAPGSGEEGVVEVFSVVAKVTHGLEAEVYRRRAGEGRTRQVQNPRPPQSEAIAPVELPQHASLSVRQLETCGIDAGGPAGVRIVEEGCAAGGTRTGGVKRDGGELARLAAGSDTLAEGCEHRRSRLDYDSNPSMRQECPKCSHIHLGVVAPVARNLRDALDAV